MGNKDFLVSVFMMTYNHEKYIAQAIGSVLMQQTNFEFEIVIGEDCSTDRTREIVLEYKAKYPEKIKLLLQEKNVGAMQNQIDTLRACTGKYIALLEGDDYWTDPYKLQKQVDFLEANPDYGLIYADLYLIDEFSNKLSNNVQELFKVKKIYEENTFFNLLRHGNFIYTATSCFRSALLNHWLSGISNNKDIYIQDVFLWLLISSQSKVKFLKETMAVYRRHSGNISSDPNTIVGHKTWEYSIMLGIDQALKNKEIKLVKNDFIYLQKLLIMKIIKSKYLGLKILALKLIIISVIRYLNGHGN